MRNEKAYHDALRKRGSGVNVGYARMDVHLDGLAVV
jgi:hypothetical protein